MRTKAKVLSPKQLQFVEGILRGLTQKDAAIQAGYSIKSAADAGCALFKNELIQRELEKYRTKIVKKTERTVESILEKNDKAHDFAYETKNANALVKCIELEAKVMGFVDNPNKSSGMVLNINLGSIDEFIKKVKEVKNEEEGNDEP